MSHAAPLISDQSAVYLARVVNRAATLFDVADFSAEEAIEVYVLLDRLMGTLWRKHMRVLLPFYLSVLSNRNLSEDEDPEGSGGSSHH